MATTWPKKPNSSPLRYPGGKSALFSLLLDVLKLNGASSGTYVEPYAGGAGLALALLFREQVENVVINDLDPAIFAFWKAITERGDDFAERIDSVRVDIDEWQRQREIYRAGTQSSTFDLGFATFFLNRTNRSGILGAGVIGGQGQTGQYKIDARFNRVALIERCRLVSLYASRIDVRSQDGVEVIKEFLGKPSTLVYADPPYFEKGSQLYMNAFSDRDHSRLADCLNAHKDNVWLLTYDNAPEIADLYQARTKSLLDVHYSMHNSRNVQELLISSDVTKMPDLD